MPKHPGGRPSEYNEKVFKKTRQYIKECQDYTYCMSQRNFFGGK